jgi:hypothetical protein
VLEVDARAAGVLRREADLDLARAVEIGLERYGLGAAVAASAQDVPGQAPTLPP